MDANFKVSQFTIQELYVNPDNARFINSEELIDEISAIKALISLDRNHAVNLARDIALNGLNPNELPIVMQDIDENRILVMDGNRRITSIKLMTQYRDKLDALGFSLSQKRELLSLKYNIHNINCVFYEKQEGVNYLLEKLHTSKPGVGQVKWDPQAQDRHQLKSGIISERLSLIEMLNASIYTSSEARKILSEKGWVSKLERYMKTKYLPFFGINFDKKNNIILYLDETEVMKGLSQLVIDLKNIHASEIAQTDSVRMNYLRQFPLDKKPNREKNNKYLIIFDVNSTQFIKTSIPNDTALEFINNNELHFKNNINETNPKIDIDIKYNNTDEESIIISKHKKSMDLKNIEEKYNLQNNILNTNLKSTDTRNTLIPKEEDIPIKNQRSLDLYNELKLINVNIYTNIVSVAFRSLLEFSINSFLKMKNNKWAYNEKITLFEKLEKTLSILESKYGKNQLELEMPGIYRYVYSFNVKDKNLNSIPFLSILIHNHNYHPNPKELKYLYNNYSPLLMYIWKEF